eukprot:c21613_g1_i2.p1 GENE.c21613_g1_i2~~c21613_g1_i2.p1  ORF type:complete len:1012 (-),score=428.22 c21613_g1_i2:233-3268(-)
MSSKKFDHQRLSSVGVELGTKWSIKKDQLIELIENKSINKLKELGGVDGLAKGLKTSLLEGLFDDNESIFDRESYYGSNVIPEPKPTSLFALMWEALQDPTLIILMGAAFISLPVGIFFEDPSTGWIEGTAILGTVLVVVLVASINDYQKERQFRDLNKKKNDIPIKVIRRGKRHQLSINEIMVGDLILLETGDSIPCDGVLCDSSDLKINESNLTGESDDVSKSIETDPFVLASTYVTDGMGTMISIAVGESSSKGRIANLVNLDDEAEETLLQKKLTTIAELIGKFGFWIASFTVVVLSLGFIIHDKLIQQSPWTSADVSIFLRFIITGLTIVVVAVPEGLPLAVTIAMAFSVKKMLSDNNLVRHLDACEVMGGATTICSDKTGTLTRNRMTVVKIWSGRQTFPLPGKDIVDGFRSKDKFKQLLTESIIHNTTAQISYDHGTRQDQGSKTECALLEFSHNLGVNKEDHVKLNFKYAHRHVFSSKRKRMSSVIALPNNKYRVFVKGASEIVVANCTSIMGLDGTVSPLSDAERREIISTAIEPFSVDSLRTLCLAYRDTNNSKDFEEAESAESNLTFLAIVGIEDPLRPEVSAAIKKCERAGIVVRMVTGDNLQTAQAIALQCGILHAGYPNDAVMEGSVFRSIVLSDPLDQRTIKMDEFRRLAPKLRVLARSSPADKFVLVKGLKQMGEIVAVTGDGTNDAPALRQANVGLSMGIQGTEIAKEASDIILMDDNFNSIVSAIKWGRNVFDSISKFVQFQLTVNIVAITTAVVGAFTIQESPLTAVQMLWVNLIMDTLASLALATEEPSEELLNRPPYDPDRSIVSPHMWINIGGQAAYQLIVMMLLIFAGPELFGLGPNGAHSHTPTVHFTMVFNTFVLLQLVNEINCRKIHGEINVFQGFFTNAYFLTIVFATAAVQILIVQFGGLAMSTVPLTVNQWIICFAFGLGSLVVGFFLHLIPESSIPEPKYKRTVSNVSSSNLGFYRGGKRRSQSLMEFQRQGRHATKTNIK